MTIIGRITKDASVKTLKDDREVVSFSLALNDYYKAKGNEQGTTVTTYINCSYWLSTKIAERLTKGSLVEISGRIYVTAYLNMDNEAKASLNCHVNSIKVHQSGKAVATKKEAELIPDLPF